MRKLRRWWLPVPGNWASPSPPLNASSLAGRRAVCLPGLSWPIAIVLTVLILLGHWGVTELGDSTAPGIGNLVATDMGLRDPSQMHVVSDLTESLAKMLNLLSKVLPDITQFSALEDIERGVALPLSRLTDSLAVIGAFGVPLTVMAYIFLRNKEVAP